MTKSDRSRLIVVVDVGLGNIHSLLGCLHNLAPNDEVKFSSDHQDINDADCIFLPGDGAFGACMDEIKQRNLREILINAAKQKHFFAICVGMQVLFTKSAEAKEGGLGILPGNVEKFPNHNGAKVPLMGWLDITVEKQHQVLTALPDNERFYFLHSYYVAADNPATVLSAKHTSNFSAAVAKDKLFGTQFHPEKSGVYGVNLIKNFLANIN